MDRRDSLTSSRLQIDGFQDGSIASFQITEVEIDTKEAGRQERERWVGLGWWSNKTSFQGDR